MKLLSGAAAALFSLLVLTMPSTAQAWVPHEWHAGDWWVVRRWCRPVVPINGTLQWMWRRDRYDVLPNETVNGHDCYVIRIQDRRSWSKPNGMRSLHYVRVSDLHIVRRVRYHLNRKGQMSPMTMDFVDESSSFFPQELSWPQSPIDTLPPADTLFRQVGRAPMMLLARQAAIWWSGEALDSVLRAGDVQGEPVLRPGIGQRALFVRYELGLDTIRPPRDSAIVPSEYSCQLWSDQFPWRLYEEHGAYRERLSPSVEERAWLVAYGHGEP